MYIDNNWKSNDRTSRHEDFVLLFLFYRLNISTIFFELHCIAKGGTIKWLVRKLRVSLAERSTDMKINEEVSSHVSKTIGMYAIITTA